MRIIIEKAENNYSAYSPDLLGCVATGDTIEKTNANMMIAIRMHIEKEDIQDALEMEKMIYEKGFEGLKKYNEIQTG